MKYEQLALSDVFWTCKFVCFSLSFLSNKDKKDMKNMKIRLSLVLLCMLIGNNVYAALFARVYFKANISDVTITFEGNNSQHDHSHDAIPSICNYKSWSWEEMEFKFTAPQKAGYTFRGWQECDDNNFTYNLDGTYKTTNYVYSFKTTGSGTSDDGWFTKKIYIIAVYEANKYTISFNANGGTGTMSNQSFTYDVSQNLTPNAYEKKATVTFDYNDGATANSTATSSATFLNWKNGTATYTDGQSVSNLSSIQGATVTLTAQWSAYSAVTLPTPTREGYKFDGWYNGDTKIDGTTYTPNGNVTLTAHWLEEAYMKIGNSNYGTFCAPFDVTIPDDLDVTIYKESKKITDYIIFSSDESRTIDAYTPVIVYSASPVDKYFYGALRTKDNCGEATLKGNLGTRFVAEEGSYVLNPSSAEKLGIAFKIVNSNTIGVGKNRCYIPAVNAAKLKSLSVVFEDKDDTTVISDLSTIFDSAISSIYSASGSKLEKMQKGMNIVKYSDGSIKKVLVK